MAARTGVQLIHHACFVDDVAMRALEARRDDVWVCPGLHYVYAMVHGHADPWGMTSDRLERSGYRRELESLVDSLQKLHAAGIRILAGGDFGHQWTHHGTYAAELAALRRARGDDAGRGDPHRDPQHRRRWSASTPARCAEGCLADLVVLDGDPTADIALLQRPDRRRAVMKDGSFVYVNPELFP